MTTLLIPAGLAAQIRATVLPAGYLASIPDPTICPCQGSPSGHCRTGRHDQCPRTQGWHRHGQPTPDTHIVSTRHHGALTAVWRTGPACRWLCPCRCHTTVQPLFAAPQRQRGRRDGALRIATTDRLPGHGHQQPALFEVSR